MPRKKRYNSRRADELRPVRITPNFVGAADGSCLFEMGKTRVICTASFVDGVPRWRKDRGLGWLTAEYGMLPASTGQRKSRGTFKVDGRSVEIQRMLGRTLRGVVDFSKFADTIYIDCDVLQADGGTRTASINGAFVALSIAALKGCKNGKCEKKVLLSQIAAVSVGIVDSNILLDLDYSEDSSAEVDMNIVMNSEGKFIEVQGAAEKAAFSAEQLDKMLASAGKGIRRLLKIQKNVVFK